MRFLPRAAIDLAIHFEGLRLDVYLDPVGIPTIGYGHVCKADHPPITKDQALEYLRQDMGIAGGAVVAALPGVDMDFLTDPRLAALADFTFNLGGTRFRASTLRRKVLDHDVVGAADEFPKWRMAGGKILAGLVKRRAAERGLWLG